MHWIGRATNIYVIFEGIVLQIFSQNSNLFRQFHHRWSRGPFFHTLFINSKHSHNCYFICRLAVVETEWKRDLSQSIYRFMSPCLDVMMVIFQWTWMVFNGDSSGSLSYQPFSISQLVGRPFLRLLQTRWKNTKQWTW